MLKKITQVVVLIFILVTSINANDIKYYLTDYSLDKKSKKKGDDYCRLISLDNKNYYIRQQRCVEKPNHISSKSKKLMKKYKCIKNNLIQYITIANSASECDQINQNEISLKVKKAEAQKVKKAEEAARRAEKNARRKVEIDIIENPNAQIMSWEAFISTVKSDPKTNCHFEYTSDLKIEIYPGRYAVPSCDQEYKRVEITMNAPFNDVTNGVRSFDNEATKIGFPGEPMVYNAGYKVYRTKYDGGDIQYYFDAIDKQNTLEYQFDASFQKTDEETAKEINSVSEYAQRELLRLHPWRAKFIKNP